MSTWYLSYNGQQTGPFDLATAAAQAKANPEGYCWRAGMSEWLPIRAGYRYAPVQNCKAAHCPFRYRHRLLQGAALM